MIMEARVSGRGTNSNRLSKRGHHKRLAPKRESADHHLIKLDFSTPFPLHFPSLYFCILAPKRVKGEKSHSILIDVRHFSASNNTIAAMMVFCSNTRFFRTSFTQLRKAVQPNPVACNIVANTLGQWSATCVLIPGVPAGGAPLPPHHALRPHLLPPPQGPWHRRLLPQLHRGGDRGRRRLLVCPDGREKTRQPAGTCFRRCYTRRRNTQIHLHCRLTGDQILQEQALKHESNSCLRW